MIGGGRETERERGWENEGSKDEAGRQEGRKHEQLPNTLHVTGNSSWIISRFCTRPCSVRWDPAWVLKSHSLYIPYISRCCTPSFTCFLALLWILILPRPNPACGWELRCRQDAMSRVCPWAPSGQRLSVRCFLLSLFLYNKIPLSFIPQRQLVLQVSCYPYREKTDFL